MFDTLTPDERHNLNLKLAGWAHEFAAVAHCLARTSFAHKPADVAEVILWSQSKQYYEVMDELHALRAEVLAA